jgi:cation/acetate symporter
VSNVQFLTAVIVGLSFALYIGIAIWSRVSTTGEFYIAGKHVHPLANGMATAADWMSAASFISMAGIISFGGYDGSVYLMGWTGGFVLLALLLAPYLRKFGKFTVPDFIGERYYSNTARQIGVLCAVIISFTYVAGQMRGVGVVFSRFLEINVDLGIVIGMIIVLFYATLGGMKGITYTQVTQYCVLIFAFMVPAIFISIMMTGNPIPQLGFGGSGADGVPLLAKLDGLHQQLGFDAYTNGSKSMTDVFCITLALMVGTAGLPHVIVRFFTVPKVKDARISAFYALLFIAILYTTAPAVAVFARTNLITSVEGKAYTELPSWFRTWEKTGLLAWVDKNEDGMIQYRKGAAIDGNKGKPIFLPDDIEGASGERLMKMSDDGEGAFNTATDNENELYVDRDIMVLANPEIAKLPDWVIALVAAGGLAAALSTAAGLLLVISSSVAHDMLRKWLMPNIGEKGELAAARIASVAAVIVAGYLGLNPPGFVAQVVALAFGLAASSFFPAIVLGIFRKRMNKEGALAGMMAGFLFTVGYICYFKFISPETNNADHWLFKISPEGIGAVGMVLNFVVALTIERFTPAPPENVQRLVEDIRVPIGSNEDVEG